MIFINQKHGLDVGDLVRIKYSIKDMLPGSGVTGLVLDLLDGTGGKWVKVYWSQDGLGLEKARDLEAVV